MSVQPLCLEPHPALRQKAQAVEAFTAEVRRLARDLTETMYAHDGVGLAAPQIGRDLQLFVANPSRQRGRELVVANPSLDASEGAARIVEGCLSLPDIWERVKRAARVRMSGQDVSGKPFTVEAKELLAIVLQHEFDHLQGRLFIDRVSWFRRRRLQKRLRGAGACG
jgi:peptide deformylase